MLVESNLKTVLKICILLDKTNKNILQGIQDENIFII